MSGVNCTTVNQYNNLNAYVWFKLRHDIIQNYVYVHLIAILTVETYLSEKEFSYLMKDHIYVFF